MEAKELAGFSQRFEQIKTRFRLRSRDLSRIAGVSDAAINKIMSGATETPDVRTLIAIGKELHLSADWLLFGEGEMIPDDSSSDSSKIQDQKLQVRDQYIKDLQQERDYWKKVALGGKPEGATEDQLSIHEMSFDQKMAEYKRLGLGSLATPVFRSTHFDGGKVGGTPFSHAENMVTIS